MSDCVVVTRRWWGCEEGSTTRLHADTWTVGQHSTGEAWFYEYVGRKWWGGRKLRKVANYRDVHSIVRERCLCAEGKP